MATESTGEQKQSIRGHSHLTTAAGVILKKLGTVPDGIVTDNGSKKDNTVFSSCVSKLSVGLSHGACPFFSGPLTPECRRKFAHRLTI